MLTSSDTPGEKPEKILVVSENQEMIFRMQGFLTKEGFEVLFIDNEKIAPELLQNDRSVDLVLLDSSQSGPQTFEACSKIREYYLPNELPVILLTARDNEAGLEEGFKVGANDYIIKPFTRAEFITRVRTSLQLHRINRATGRFVPNEFLRVIGRDNITEVQLGDHSAQEVTILFTDIREYTTLAESMTPEDNFLLVNAYHRRMGPLIINNHGFVNQFLGDGIMCVFPGNPGDALRSTIDMQKYLRKYNLERTAKGRRPLRVGMGMHTGLLIMGITGDGQRFDAATIADSVNTAARMEGLTKLYGAPVLLSSDSHRKLDRPEDFHFRYLGEVQLKGKKNPIGAYECLDSYSSEHKDKKLKTLEQFNRAINCYLNKDFSGASILFKDVLSYNQDDATARLFLSRAEHYAAQGVPDDWTGVEVLQVK